MEQQELIKKWLSMGEFNPREDSKKIYGSTVFKLING
jgi:hypothetical protein